MVHPLQPPSPQGVSRLSSCAGEQRNPSQSPNLFATFYAFARLLDALTLTPALIAIHDPSANLVPAFFLNLRRRVRPTSVSDVHMVALNQANSASTTIFEPWR